MSKLIQILILALFATASSTFHAQDNLPNLLEQYKSETNQEERFEISSQLVWYYMHNNNDSCDLFLNECFRVSDQLNDSELKGQYYLLSARVSKIRSNYNDAINFSLKAISYFEEAENKEGVIKANTVIGHIYALRQEYDSSFEYYDFAIKEANKQNSPLLKLSALIGKGNVLYYLQEFDEAEKTFNEAIAISEKFNSTNLQTKAGLYTNTGNLYLTKEDYLKASSLYRKAFDIYFSLNDKYSMSLTAYNLGDAFLGLNEYDSSKKYFNINLFLGEELNSLEEIKYAYQGFTNLYEQQGDYQSALESHYKFAAYADSVRDHQYSAELEALTQKFQENEKLKLTEEKLAHSEEIRSKQQQMSIILIVAIIIVVLAVVVVFILYKKSLQKSSLLLQTSREIEAQNKEIDKALLQKETLLKEVHHRVKNNLQLIASLLNLQSATMENESAKEAIEESKSRVQAIALMHKGLYQDDNYSSVELSSYVNELVENLKMLSRSSERMVTFNTDVDDIQLDIDKSVPIGLILSELISNSLKHAFDFVDEGEIFISVKNTNSGFLLNYSDNGKGFPEDFNINEQESLGFTIINALVDQIEGKLIVQSYSPVQIQLNF